MRNSTSILSLLLAIGIYGAGPIVTKFGPFAAAVAFAEGADTGGDGDSGLGGHVGDDDSAGNGDQSDDHGDGTPSPVGDVNVGDECNNFCELNKRQEED